MTIEEFKNKLEELYGDRHNLYWDPSYDRAYNHITEYLDVDEYDPGICIRNGKVGLEGIMPKDDWYLIQGEEITWMTPEEALEYIIKHNFIE